MSAKEINFFLLKLGKKLRSNTKMANAISRVRGDIAPFVKDNNTGALYAFVWETYAQLRIAYHEWHEQDVLLERRIYAKVAQRLEGYAC